MSDQTVSLEVVLRSVQSDTVQMRNILLGHSPVIVIGLEMDSPDNLMFDVDSTGPESAEELAEILELLVMALRDGEPTEETDQKED